jgi:hypothetical protein
MTKKKKNKELESFEFAWSSGKFEALKFLVWHFRKLSLALNSKITPPCYITFMVSPKS